MLGSVCSHVEKRRGGEKRKKKARREKRHEARGERERWLIFLVGQNV